MGAAAHGDRTRRRAGATALTAAVIGGLLGGLPAAQAAPPPGGDEGTPVGAEDTASKAEGPAPAVWPRPQSTHQRGSFVPVGRNVTLVSREDTDSAALAAVRAALREAGARNIAEVRPGQPLPAHGPVVHADSGPGGTPSSEALRALRAPERGDLPRGGYRLAVGRTDGRDTVALEGTDGPGLFNAAQTLRQLVSEDGGSRGFAGVSVRDWPTAPVRGITEGFYGNSWSQQERLEQLDFLGRTKQNRYLYASTDDPYRQSAHWRDPYPAAQRADFRELAERARRNHVTLGWAVSPGQGLCFSSADDRRALLRKLDAMRSLGFGAFQLSFEDVSYSEWHCDEDAQTYGSGAKAAARAQAELANAVSRHLSERHPDAEPLSVMPTEFYQDGATDYRTALAERLDPDVQVAWSGVGVVPRTITGGQLSAARSAFSQHPLVTMDNYPVNDYAQDRIFLGPYRGREPAVAARSAAVLTTAMKQPTASRIPQFTAADYAWNPKAYDPQKSWQAAVDALAGRASSGGGETREAVHALAANDASSLLGGEESAYLRPLLDAFWKAYEDAGTGKEPEVKRLRKAGARLSGAFRTMRTAQEHVPAALAREVRPWLEELGRRGEAGEAAVRMLTAQARGDGAAAWDARLALKRLRAEDTERTAVVGKGVLPEFEKRALKTSDSWAGVHRRAFGDEKAEGGPVARPDSPADAAVDGDPDTAYRAEAAPATSYFAPGSAAPGASLPGGLDQYGSPGNPAGPRGEKSGPRHAKPRGTPALTVRLPGRRPLEAVTVQTGPGSGTRARVEAHVPGEGWRSLGRLSDSGWTQKDAGGLRADALRLAWSEGSDEPVVHEITPWYADSPDASLSLSKEEIFAPVGGGAGEVTAELRAHRPSGVRGKVTAKAPDGFTVRTAPVRTVVPRGGTAEVRVEVEADSSVKPGSYRIPVSFGDERRTLTVRAVPQTGGPDLARDAEAESSADETRDFPASAVNDGRSDTRWSSPAKDGEWLQLKLPGPARLGHLVLHWQDAYAARYRVQVSPDGKRWRTAATVRDGEGGRESVRMDSPSDTRYVRIQGDKRATRFGYSLWSLEAYAVREADARDD